MAPNEEGIPVISVNILFILLKLFKNVDGNYLGVVLHMNSIIKENMTGLIYLRKIIVLL